MDYQKYDLGESPTIIIKNIMGKLTIKGLETNKIKCESKNRQLLKTEEKDNKIFLSSQGNCKLIVPLKSNITIKSVKGNFSLNRVSGELSIGEIMGAANISNVINLSVKTINGSANIANVDDLLSIKAVHGNLSLKDVFGKTIITQCSGNISVSGISGGFELKTSGNTILNIDPDPVKDYKVTSTGNIFCQVPANTGFEAKLNSKSGIQVNAPFIELEENEPNSKHIQIGDGGSKFDFASVGKITLSVEGHYGKFSSSDANDIAHDALSFSSEVVHETIISLENSLSDLNRDLKVLSIELPDNKAILKKTRKDLLKARRDLERDLAASRRQINRSVRRKAHGPSIVIRKGTDDPVSNEERVKILQMVENGLIDVADAEMLLAAIEGKPEEKSID